jgi:hypothetical protein
MSARQASCLDRIAVIVSGPPTSPRPTAGPSLPAAERRSRPSQKGGVYGPSDLSCGGRRIAAFSRIPRRPHLRRLAGCWTVSRGGAAHRPETPPPHFPGHRPQQDPRRQALPGTCRTDRCRWAASRSAAAHSPGRNPATETAPETIELTRRPPSGSALRATQRSCSSNNQGGRSGDQAAAPRPPDRLRITRGLDPVTLNCEPLYLLVALHL